MHHLTHCKLVQLYVSSDLVVTMLSEIHAIVSSIEENRPGIAATVTDFRAVLQQRPPVARESWNCACLLWHAIVKIADDICARRDRTSARSTISASACFKCEQWQTVYQLASDLLQWSTEQGHTQTPGPLTLRAMKVQLQLFDAEVHAAHHDWEKTWQSLQNLTGSAQTLVCEESEDPHSLSLLFHQFALQLVAAWRLGHCSGAEESYKLCKEVTISVSETGSSMDWMPLLKYLIASHIEQADFVLMNSHSSGSISLTWKVLHQAEACIQTDMADCLASASDQSRSWADTMLSEVWFARCEGGVQDLKTCSIHALTAIPNCRSAYDKLSPLLSSWPLARQKLAPAIASLFATPGEMDAEQLTCLFGHDGVTEDIFGACLSHVATANVSTCLELLCKALDHFGQNNYLFACLWHVQLQSNEDIEALSLFVNMKHVRAILQQHAKIQEMLFVKLHAWTLHLVNTAACSLDVVIKYLDACQICAQPAQLPILHHTWALAALTDKRLDLSLEHVELLLRFNEAGQCDSSHAVTIKGQRNLAGHLLRFKVLCMGGDTQAVIAEVTAILQQRMISTDELSVIAKGVYHDCSVSTAQAVLLHLLAAMVKVNFELKLAPDTGNHGNNPALELRIAKALVLILALPLDVQRSKLAAAQAIQEKLVGKRLSWLHFVPQTLEHAVKFSKLCETCVKRMADGVGEGVHVTMPWPNEGLNEMAANFFNMAAQAANMQQFRHSVLLWRSAGYLWSQMPRISIEHLRFSNEAYLLASEGTVRIAETEERDDQKTAALARVLLAHAKEQQCFLKQHMFYMESQQDHQRFVRLALCEVLLRIIEADTEEMGNAVQSLVTLRPEPSILQSAAYKLSEDYPCVASQVLRNALQQFLERHGKTRISAADEADTPLHVAQMGRALLNHAQDDCDRIQILELMLEVARLPSMTACYPAIEAHFVCAKAFNMAVCHMRSNNQPMAQSVMSLASELAGATQCKIVTPEKCHAAAQSFLAGLAEL